MQLKFVQALHSDPFSAELIAQEIFDRRAVDLPLVCYVNGTWSQKESSLCFYTRWNIFSKWVFDNDSDEQELFYRLIDDELVICNDSEFGANNEAILTAPE